MMETKTILKNGIQVVTFLFAAFGSFLLEIAPPEEVESRFAVGISSILALFSLLLITSLIKTHTVKRKKIWLIASLTLFIIAFTSAIFYKSNINKLTFSYPPENPAAQYIAGIKMTPSAQKHSEKYPNKTISEIVADFEGPAFIERIWTKDSLRKAKMLLTINYIIVILSTATMLFCLTEGILTAPKRKGAKS